MAESQTTMNKEPSSVSKSYSVNTDNDFQLGISSTCNEYLSEFSIEDTNIEHNLSHRFYGYKRKELPNYECEVFPLPDDPIFTNTSHFFTQITKSALDIETADPWDLCLINLNYLDSPWLVDYLLVAEHVKTPYYHVDSLFYYDEIRCKVEPDTKDSSAEGFEPDDLDVPLCDTMKTTVFTSTPVKSQAMTVENSFTVSNPLLEYKKDNDKSSRSESSPTSVVATIKLPNKNDNNVDLLILKDHVIKALEEVIKSKDTMTNIDMKIQIVTSLSENEVTPSKEACVKLRIDDCGDTASSSKENHSLDVSNYCEKDSKILKGTSEHSQILNEGSSTNASSCTDVEIETLDGPEENKCKIQSWRRKRKRRFLLPTRRSIRSLRNTLSSSSLGNLKENQKSSINEEYNDLVDRSMNDCLNSTQESFNSPVFVKNGIRPSINIIQSNKSDLSMILNSTSDAKTGKHGKSGIVSEDMSTESSSFDCDIILNKTKELGNQNASDCVPLSRLSNEQILSSRKSKKGVANDELSHENDFNVSSQFVKPSKNKHWMLNNCNIKVNGQMRRADLHGHADEQTQHLFNKQSKDVVETGITKLSSSDIPTKSDDTNKLGLLENNNVTIPKRILRSSFKTVNQTIEISQEKRRRTFSNSGSIIPPNLQLCRQRSVSENNTMDAIKCEIPNSNEQSNSRISFGLSSSIDEHKTNVSRQFKPSKSQKGILKNIFNDSSNISMDMCSSDDISNVFYGLPELSREDAEIEKEEDKKKLLMKENGIINRVKIVLNPLATLSELHSDHVEKECPRLSAELPFIETKKTDKITHLDISQTTDLLSDIPDLTSTLVEDKLEMKKPYMFDYVNIEETFYNVGDLVWAQVSRYPYWPAIICNDPFTERHCEQVESKSKLNTQKWLYHLKFFGDHGRRAWVNRCNLMPYFNRDDLDLRAQNLKSEGLQNRNFRVSRMKRFLRKGGYKWERAVEEIESQKHNHYEEILSNIEKNTIIYMEQLREKRRRTVKASSESESEDPEDEKPRNKKFKDLSIQKDNAVELDEINFSMGTKPPDIQVNPCAVKLNISSNDITKRSLSVEFNNSDLANNSHESQRCVRRSGRSLKSVDKLDMLTLQIKNKGSLVLNPVSVSSQELIKNDDEKMQENREGDEVKESRESSDKDHFDRASEVGSKASSDTTVSDSSIYTFEYQFELHKRNNLYWGLKHVKVCEYCLKQGGTVYKCKGKCNGSYHLDCASLVMQSRLKMQPKRDNKSPSKSKFRLSYSSAPRRSEEGCRTRSQANCEIVTIKSKRVIDAPVKESFPQNLSIAEQIDFGMKEMMSKFANGDSVYQDSTDSSSEEGSVVQLNSIESPRCSSTALEEVPDCNEDVKSSGNSEILLSSEGSNSYIGHVTADSVVLVDPVNVVCAYCRTQMDPPCFACGLEVSKKGETVRQKCSLYRCGKYFHAGCLKMWPQTQWPISGKWSKDSFTCPAHRCHTCFSEELGSSVSCRLPGDKLARCLLCPAAFHATTFCTPAGCEILGGSQILCPRHRSRPIQPINTVWCFICSQGGNLICCDTCPTSVHPECQPVLFTDDDKYICEDCESGRFPLYDEIVWVKLGHFRWWPAIILFPNEVPVNVRCLKHQKGDFVVQFFGTNDYHWVNKSRSFLFQEGDTGDVSPRDVGRLKSKVYELFGKAIEEAAKAYQLKKEFKLRREAECIDSLKPPHYIKINKNKPVGRVKYLELNLSNATACECNPNVPFPCGPDSSCINRLLMTECDPDVCSAGSRCRNQAFQKREYPLMVPYKTQGRGWGLKSLAPIKKGQFIIEYVGELIDSEEYQRRIKKMHEKKEENYYFMTVDGDRMIDAGPKGNLSRFMNHCCDPNCVTQKWTVKGETRVGLFAKCNIESGSELTFNYNLEVVGQEKKVCKCGASNCSGFIGVKAIKLEKTEKVSSEHETLSSEQAKRGRRSIKKSSAPVPLAPPCFVCGRKKSDITCNNKFCNKGYHLRCLELTEMPDASKYACPRHNCNICTHRTIRCCVKCTNSFCPSHSDGNVRYDKFLGFVCRLHDPGISPADVPTDENKGISKYRFDQNLRPQIVNGQNEHNSSRMDLSKKTIKPPDPGERSVTPVKSRSRSKKRIRSRRPSGKVTKAGRIRKRKLSIVARKCIQPEPSWLITDNNRLRDPKGKFCSSKKNNKFHASKMCNSEPLLNTNQDDDGENSHSIVASRKGSAVAVKCDTQTFRTSSVKRQRSKIESPVDEATVSSTTSDEETITRQSAKLVARLKTPENNDQASTSINLKSHSEDLDDVSLLDRLLYMKEKVPKKRMRYSVTRFSSTAKST